MTPATLTRPQHLEALDRANLVRVASAELRREVFAGCLSVADALEDDRSGCLSIARLLASQRRWGPWRAERLLRELGITESRRCSALTVRQKRLVVEALDDSGDK